MSRIVSLIKAKVRGLRAIAALFAAGVLLLTTACQAPPSPRAAGSGVENPGTRQPTELYKPTQEYKGGMNKYEDTDPRRELTGANQKSDALIQEAKQNLRKVEDPGDFAENYREGTPLGERVKNIGEGVEESLENVGKDLDLTNPNVPRDEIRDVGSRNARNILQSGKKGVERTAEDASGTANKASREAAKEAQRALEDATGSGNQVVKQTQRAAEDTKDAVGDTLNEAARDARRNLKDAADAVTR
ncbi:MAG: hypothetical protein ACFB8W_01400 [Elainellaceae cyanobacterium]